MASNIRGLYYICVSLLFVALNLQFSEAHSYLSCSHRLVDGTCLGYPRGFASYDLQKAGYVTLTKQGAFLKPSLPGNTASVDWTRYYTAKYPMPVVKAGQNITLQWAGFNHGISLPNMPVNAPAGVLRIFKNPNINPLSDVSPDVYKQNVVGSGYFKHCGLSTHTQDEMCSTTLNVGDTVGVNSFLWWWQFNNEEEVYTSVFDVYVTGSADSVPSELTSVVRSDGFGLGGQNTTITNMIPANLQDTSASTPGFFKTWLGSPLVQMVKGQGKATISEAMKQLGMAQVTQEEADQFNANNQALAATEDSLQPSQDDLSAAESALALEKIVASYVKTSDTGANLVSNFVGQGTGGQDTTAEVSTSGTDGNAAAISTPDSPLTGSSSSNNTVLVASTGDSQDTSVALGDVNLSTNTRSSPIQNTVQDQTPLTQSGYPTPVAQVSPSTATSGLGNDNSGYSQPSLTRCKSYRRRHRYA